MEKPETEKEAATARIECYDLFGWTELSDATPPPRDLPFEVLHFGHFPPGHQIIQDGKWDDYGPIGVSDDDGHRKRSTITHWRCKPNAD